MRTKNPWRMEGKKVLRRDTGKLLGHVYRAVNPWDGSTTWLSYEENMKASKFPTRHSACRYLFDSDDLFTRMASVGADAYNRKP